MGNIGPSGYLCGDGGTVTCKGRGAGLGSSALEPGLLGESISSLWFLQETYSENNLVSGP